MKSTLIIIKCESGVVFSQLAKLKINETNQLKLLDYELIMNPIDINILDLNLYKRVYIISHPSLFIKKENIENVSIDDFVINPQNY